MAGMLGGGGQGATATPSGAMTTAAPEVLRGQQFPATTPMSLSDIVRDPANPGRENVFLAGQAADTAAKKPGQDAAEADEALKRLLGQLKLAENIGKLGGQLAQSAQGPGPSPLLPGPGPGATFTPTALRFQQQRPLSLKDLLEGSR